MTESPALFGQARQVAVASTRAIVDALLDTPGIKDNLQATAALMGTSTLALVIDDTLSMDEELPVVKAIAQQLVDDAVAAGQTPEYLLVRFKDADDISQPFITTDAAAFMAQVNALVPDGESYCPEGSGGATYAAVAASIPGSKVYTFTDAAVDDGYNATAASMRAEENKIRIAPVLTGSCSPIDPALKRMARETGGQLFFITPSELGSLPTLIRPQLAGDFQPLLVANGVLAGTARLFQIPIDPTVRHAVFSVSIDTLSATSVKRPDGTTVAAGNPGVTVQNLSAGAVVAVRDARCWNMDRHRAGDRGLLGER